MLSKGPDCSFTPCLPGRAPRKGFLAARKLLLARKQVHIDSRREGGREGGGDGELETWRVERMISFHNKTVSRSLNSIFRMRTANEIDDAMISFTVLSSKRLVGDS